MSELSENAVLQTPMLDPSRLEIGQLVDGRFRLREPLGQGGTGVVWLAEDEVLDERVALKFLAPAFQKGTKALDNLRQETARCHRLSHPNIVRLFDFHHSALHGAYVSMEYAGGSSLSQLRWGRPDPFFRWAFLQPLVLQLCEALSYAHGENVIHRDLKPGNLILNNQGRLKLADFGIAAVVVDPALRISPSLRPVGTVHYMSPQQLSGLTPQPTDDVYSLGATLYDLLSGHPPFFLGDIAHQIREVMPEPLSRRLRRFGLQNDIPPHIEALVMACLAKRPVRRPQSAAAVAEWTGPELRLRGIRSRLRGWRNRMSSISRPGGQS